MFDFIKRNLLNDRDGINGIITIILCAILLTTFEVLFFMNIGLPNIQSGLKLGLKKIKNEVDKKILGNKNYCKYLQNRLNSNSATDHSKNIISNFCNNTDINEIIEKKQKAFEWHTAIEKTNDIYNTFYDNKNSHLGKYSYYFHDYDQISQFKTIENIIISIFDKTENMANPDVITSSIYDYYRKHPEILKSSSVVKNILQNKFNEEVAMNSWELIGFLCSGFIIFTGMFKMLGNNHFINWQGILQNVSFTVFFIIIFQIYFYKNVSMKYEYDGLSFDEIINYYIKKNINQN
tara:strand:+ start:1767 stop:2642 length:876 start_codon:yes stop_codon:yes gene_type:complete